MDYQISSRSQKKSSPAGSNSSPASSIPTTTQSARVSYFTAIANSSTSYESPYAQGRDKRPQPPTAAAIRASTISTATRSSSVDPAYKRGSPPVRGALSTSSSSSGGSLYTSSPSRQQQQGDITETMSSSRDMSSVSQIPYLRPFTETLSSVVAMFAAPFSISRKRNVRRDVFPRSLSHNLFAECIIPASVGWVLRRVRGRLISCRTCIISFEVWVCLLI